MVVLGLTLCFSESNTTSKFDFIPGEKVIFYDDFSAESVGDFPVQWLTNGSGEIVTSAKFEGRWFQITKTGYYIPEAKELNTENYTIEFDLVVLNNEGGASSPSSTVDLFLLSGELSSPMGGSQPGQAGFRIHSEYDIFSWNNWSEALEWQGDEGQVACTFKASQKYHMALWVQKQRVRVYANDQKILDLPRGLQPNYTYNIFRIEDNSDETTPLISNFRIATGLPDTRNKLITEGKLISYGIYFDVNSDKVKPESNATLKEISQVLKDNPAVKITIVGHTDSDGETALNLALSKRRALSVKKELNAAFGIETSRLETDGKGEGLPLAANDNALNKAKNRRVEFIKQ